MLSNALHRRMVVQLTQLGFLYKMVNNKFWIMCNTFMNVVLITIPEWPTRALMAVHIGSVLNFYLRISRALCYDTNGYKWIMHLSRSPSFWFLSIMIWVFHNMIAQLWDYSCLEPRVAFWYRQWVKFVVNVNIMNVLIFLGGLFAMQTQYFNWSTIYQFYFNHVIVG